MQTVHLISFIVSLIVAAILIFFGVYGLAKPSIAIYIDPASFDSSTVTALSGLTSDQKAALTNLIQSNSGAVSTNILKLSEWVMLVLGVILLGVSILSFMHHSGIGALASILGAKTVVTPKGDSVVTLSPEGQEALEEVMSPRVSSLSAQSSTVKRGSKRGGSTPWTM